MTEPLIRKDTLAAVIYGAEVDQGDWKYDAPTVRTTEMVLAYLREVLTPEALNPPGEVPVFVQIGDDWIKIEDLLHRRIFGEDG